MFLKPSTTTTEKPEYPGKVLMEGLLTVENLNKKFWQKAWTKKYCVLSNGRLDIFSKPEKVDKKPEYRIELDRFASVVDIENFKGNSNTFGVRLNPAQPNVPKGAPQQVLTPGASTATTATLSATTAASPSPLDVKPSGKRRASAFGDHLTTWFFSDEKESREKWVQSISDAIQETKQGALRLMADVVKMVKAGQIKDITILIEDKYYNVNAKVFLPQQFRRTCMELSRQGVVSFTRHSTNSLSCSDLKLLSPLEELSSDTTTFTSKSSSSSSKKQSALSVSSKPLRELKSSPLTASYFGEMLTKGKDGASVMTSQSLDSSTEDEEKEEEDDQELIKTGYVHFDTMLHIACSNGHVQLAEYLLSKGANPNSINSYGKSPLHKIFDCMTNREELAKLLINAKCNVNYKDVDGWTPMLLSFQQNEWKIVPMLLEAGGDALYYRKNDTTPLHYAAKGKQKQIVNILLEKGADPNVLDSDELYPIDYALEFEREFEECYEIVKSLLNKNAIVNLKEKQYIQSYLPAAVELGLLDVIQQVCEVNQDLVNYEYIPYQGSLKKTSLLTRAIQNSHIEIVKFLIEGPHKDKLDVNKAYEIDDEPKTALHTACECNQEEIVRLVLNHASFNPYAKSGSEELYPIMLAYKYKLSQDIKDLITEKMTSDSSGTNNNNNDLSENSGSGQTNEIGKNSKLFTMTSKSGKTLLDVAAETGDVEVVKKLISEGADPNHVTSLGQNVLSIACTHGYIKLVKFLIEDIVLNVNGTGYEKYITNSYPPLHCAVICGNLDLVKYFIEEKGVSVDFSKRELQMKPIHLACLHGHTHIVDYFLDKGVDLTSTINTSDDKGINALHLACGYGFDQVARLLIEKGNMKIQERTQKQLSALDFAVRRMQFKVIKLLSEKGATTDELTIQLAIQTQNEELMELIETAKSKE